MARPSRAQRLLHLGGANQRALAEAFVSLAAASIAIKMLPFRRTVELMGLRPANFGANQADRNRIVAQCRWAVRSWADRVPWRAVCFQRGLALHMMLRRRGIPSVLHYGVAQNLEEGLRAHVWLSVDGKPMLGGEEARDFTCVATFPAQDRGRG
jgi:hypothetical protein